MKNDLIERYVYAVTKQLNHKVRQDVSMELKGLIEDMLQERCGENQPQEADIKAVLTELGTPAELAAKYDDGADSCLIGQPYYTAYRQVIKLILAIVAAGLTLSAFIIQILEPKPILEAFGLWFSSLLNGLISGFGIVTLIFAVLSHRGAKLPFSLEDLPTVPAKAHRISTGDCIFEICFHAVFLCVFLALPQVFSAKVGDLWVPVFDIPLLRSNWYIFVLFSLAGIIREVVKLMEKRYNRRVLAVSLGADLISAALAFWWLLGRNIFSPEFLGSLTLVFPEEAQIIYSLFQHFNPVLLACMMLGLVMDFLTALWKLER